MILIAIRHRGNRDQLLAAVDIGWCRPRQSGVERVYNKVLMGQDGARVVMVNSTGREIRELEVEQPVEGFPVGDTGSGAVDNSSRSSGATVARNASLGTVPVWTDPRFFREPS